MGNTLFAKTSDMEIEDDNTSIESLDIEEITDQEGMGEPKNQNNDGQKYPEEAEEPKDTQNNQEEENDDDPEKEENDEEPEDDGQEEDDEDPEEDDGQEEEDDDQEEDQECQGLSSSDINDFFNACADIETFTAYMKSIYTDDATWMTWFLNQEMINEEGTHLGTPLTSLIDPNGFCNLDLSDDEEFNMRLAIIKYLLTYAPKFLNLDIKSTIDYGITDMTFLEAVQQLKITPGFSRNYTEFLQEIEDYLNKKLY